MHALQCQTTSDPVVCIDLAGQLRMHAGNSPIRHASHSSAEHRRHHRSRGPRRASPAQVGRAPAVACARRCRRCRTKLARAALDALDAAGRGRPNAMKISNYRIEIIGFAHIFAATDGGRYDWPAARSSEPRAEPQLRLQPLCSMRVPLSRTRRDTQAAQTEGGDRRGSTEPPCRTYARPRETTRGLARCRYVVLTPEDKKNARTARAQSERQGDRARQRGMRKGAVK